MAQAEEGRVPLDQVMGDLREAFPYPWQWILASYTTGEGYRVYGKIILTPLVRLQTLFTVLDAYRDKGVYPQWLRQQVYTITHSAGKELIKGLPDIARTINTLIEDKAKLRVELEQAQAEITRVTDPETGVDYYRKELNRVQGG